MIAPCDANAGHRQNRPSHIGHGLAFSIVAELYAHPQKRKIAHSNRTKINVEIYGRLIAVQN